jgi:FkbM family methyltransferase
MNRDFRTLVFVGTNDTFDVIGLTRQFECAYLFEPIADVAQRLRYKLRRHPNATVIAAACGTEEGVQDFNIINEQGLSSSFGIPTVQAKQHYAMADLSVADTVQVPVIHLGKALRRFSITTIDHLRIDAQGMDLEILKTVEPWLKRHDIKTARTEADAPGFQHYEGMENGTEAQLGYMGQFDYLARVPVQNEYGGEWIHGDINWRANQSGVNWYT